MNYTEARKEFPQTDPPPPHISLQLFKLYIPLFDNPMSNFSSGKGFVLVISQKDKTGYAVVCV
jgi:hypothetical protein